MSKILIGNLSTETVEDEVREVFTGTSGLVNAVDIPTDPRTGKCRGYAFVLMSTDAEAQKAVTDLSGHSINGRRIAMSLVEGQSTKRKWYQFNAHKIS